MRVIQVIAKDYQSEKSPIIAVKRAQNNKKTPKNGSHIGLQSWPDISQHPVSFNTQQVTILHTRRTVEAVLSIGPAVLNGGFTTFLALVLCSLSTGHVFLTFFKVFTLTVVFGLFNGVILLPVILSLVGPSDTSDGTFSCQDEAQKTSSKINIDPLHKDDIRIEDVPESQEI